LNLPRYQQVVDFLAKAPNVQLVYIYKAIAPPNHITPEGHLRETAHWMDMETDDDDDDDDDLFDDAEVAEVDEVDDEFQTMVNSDAEIDRFFGELGVPILTALEEDDNLVNLDEEGGCDASYDYNEKTKSTTDLRLVDKALVAVGLEAAQLQKWFNQVDSKGQGAPNTQATTFIAQVGYCLYVRKPNQKPCFGSYPCNMNCKIANVAKNIDVTKANAEFKRAEHLPLYYQPEAWSWMCDRRMFTLKEGLRFQELIPFLGFKIQQQQQAQEYAIIDTSVPTQRILTQNRRFLSIREEPLDMKSMKKLNRKPGRVAEWVAAHLESFIQLDGTNSRFHKIVKYMDKVLLAMFSAMVDQQLFDRLCGAKGGGLHIPHSISDPTFFDNWETNWIWFMIKSRVNRCHCTSLQILQIYRQRRSTYLTPKSTLFPDISPTHSNNQKFLDIYWKMFLILNPALASSCQVLDLLETNRYFNLCNIIPALKVLTNVSTLKFSGTKHSFGVKGADHPVFLNITSLSIWAFSLISQNQHLLYTIFPNLTSLIIHLHDYFVKSRTLDGIAKMIGTKKNKRLNCLTVVVDQTEHSLSHIYFVKEAESFLLTLGANNSPLHMHFGGLNHKWQGKCSRQLTVFHPPTKLKTKLFIGKTMAEDNGIRWPLCKHFDLKTTTPQNKQSKTPTPCAGRSVRGCYPSTIGPCRSKYNLNEEEEEGFKELCGEMDMMRADGLYQQPQAAKRQRREMKVGGKPPIPPNH